MYTNKRGGRIIGYDRKRASREERKRMKKIDRYTEKKRQEEK